MPAVPFDVSVHGFVGPLGFEPSAPLPASLPPPSSWGPVPGELEHAASEASANDAARMERFIAREDDTKFLKRPPVSPFDGSMRSVSTALFALLVTACTLKVDVSGSAPSDAGAPVAPSGRGGGTRSFSPFPFHELDAGSITPPPPPTPPPTTNGIDYHGGAVLTSPVRVYFVWYGDWSHRLANTILLDWVTGVGGTPYFAINTSYGDGYGHAATDQVSFGGQSHDAYSQGKSLGDANVEAIVTGAIHAHALPLDANGVYFVLASKEVDETSGFCATYCGWHTSRVVSGKHVRFGFVGDPARCPGSCEAQAISPNLDPAADGMASVLSHELSEAITDPDGAGWYDSTGAENADKCAWKFGAESALPTGAHYNVSFGGRHWLLQENWVNAGGGRCAMHL